MRAAEDTARVVADALGHPTGEASLGALIEAASSPRSPFTERFCTEKRKLYYYDATAKRSTWEPPPAFVLREVLTDMASFELHAMDALLCFQAVDLLKLGGFRRADGDAADAGWHFPENGDTRRARAIAARLERIVDGKGHTGEAKPTDSTAKRSVAHGTPGFERQHDIYECSVCAHAINDGSTRILRGDAGAPRGEFRYSCQQCESFHLCEACYDRHESGVAMHTAGHTFAHHGPRTSRWQSAEGDSAWGRQRGPIPARARQRLKDRTGH